LDENPVRYFWSSIQNHFALPEKSKEILQENKIMISTQISTTFIQLRNVR